MKLIYKNQKKLPSKFGGDMYYLFFNDGQKSYRTCIYTAFRNFPKWERLIRNIKKGDIVLNCHLKSNGMIDADSTPKYGGNIYEKVNQ